MFFSTPIKKGNESAYCSAMVILLTFSEYLNAAVHIYTRLYILCFLCHLFQSRLIVSFLTLTWYGHWYTVPGSMVGFVLTMRGHIPPASFPSLLRYALAVMVVLSPIQVTCFHGNLEQSEDSLHIQSYICLYHF